MKLLVSRIKPLFLKIKLLFIELKTCISVSDGTLDDTDKADSHRFLTSFLWGSFICAHLLHPGKKGIPNCIVYRVVLDLFAYLCI